METTPRSRLSITRQSLFHAHLALLVNLLRKHYSFRFIFLCIFTRWVCCCYSWAPQGGEGVHLGFRGLWLCFGFWYSLQDWEWGVLFAYFLQEALRLPFWSEFLFTSRWLGGQRYSAIKKCDYYFIKGEVLSIFQTHKSILHHNQENITFSFPENTVYQK